MLVIDSPPCYAVRSVCSLKSEVSGLQVRAFLPEHVGYDDGAGGVTGDVECGAAHVEDAVHAGHQGDALQRKSDRGKDHRQHDHASAGNSGGSDRCEGRGQDDSDHLRGSQVDAVAGRDEDRADALIDRGGRTKEETSREAPRF